MSTLDDKLNAPRGTLGRGRATLNQLRLRWGKLRLTEGTPIDPIVFELTNIDGRTEVWKHVSGRGGKAIFERTA
jgi:hypothetical protein